MDELTQVNIEEFVRRFECLDGGVIQRIEVDLKEKVVELRLTAFDAYRPAAQGCVTICLRLARVSEFCFREGVKQSGVQLDDHLEVIWIDGAVYVLLDPLHARDFNQVEWTIDQVRRSRWYAGGESLTWALSEQLSPPADVA